MKIPSLAKQLVPASVRNFVRQRRHAKAALQPPLHEKLLPLIASYRIHGERGFYVESGAHDGVAASNTLPLERLGWRGILVEPSVSAFEACKRNRAPDNHFVNCALVGDPDLSSVRGDFDGHPMSSIDSVRRRTGTLSEVPAQTLQAILDRHDIKRFDFLSLDVEGAELEVLRGINFSRSAPTLVVVEIYDKDRDEIFDFMSSRGYTLPIDVSGFTKSNYPYWDGTHNDYFFALDSDKI